MQFKELGNLFDGSFVDDSKLIFGEFKNVASLSDLSANKTNVFGEIFKLNANGLSEFTTAQIQAKSAAMGLTDSLSTELIAMGKDATFAQKAATGKLTWGKALQDNTISIEDLGNALTNSTSTASGAVDALKRVGDSAGTTSDKYKDLVKIIINGENGFDDISDSIIDLGEAGAKSTSWLDGAAATIKGMFASLKSIAPVLIGIAAVAGTLYALDYSQHGFTRALEDAENAANEYSAAQDQLANLNSEYETQKQKIEELQALKSAGTITMDQEVELQNLQNQNTELERQIDLQTNLLNIKAQASADAARNASNKEQSFLEYNEEKYGKIGGWLMTLGGSASYNDPITGKPTSAAIQWADKDTSVSGKVKEDIKNLESYKKQLSDIQNKYVDSLDDKNVIRSQENLNKLIEETTESLDAESQQLNAWIAQSVDSNGNPLEGMEKYVDSWRKTLTDIQNIGKSQSEIDLNNLNTFFSSSSGSGIEKRLENIVRSSGNASDALKEFQSLGLSLDDIGVSKSGFIRYFEDVKRAAEEASEAVNSVDGSFEGVEAAFESENQGAKYNKMVGYLKQAQELYENGKIGTDEFQATAQWIMPNKINEDLYKYDAEAYKAAWESAYKTVSRWFDEDNPVKSMWNFTDDLYAKNSSLFKTYDKAAGEIEFNTDNFKSTADAAKELGVNAQVVETILHNMEEYGFEFDGIMFSNEGLETFKTSLEDIRTLYDSMSDGSEKDRLGKLIENWDSEYEKYQDDLSLLTEDQIVKIEFEYDLATLSSDIQDAKDKIKDSGGSSEDYASLLSSQKEKRDFLSSQDNLSSAINDEGYKESLYAADELAQKLVSNYNELGESGRRELQQQQSAIYDLQNSYLEMFQDGDIADWESFLGTNEASEIIHNLADETGQSVQKVRDELAKMFDVDSESINIDLKVEKSELENTINDLKDGQSITFSASLDDGSVAEIEGYKNEDGEIRYTANIDGAEYAVSSITHNLDGTITYTANVDGVLTHLTAVQNEDGTITYTVNEVPGEQVEKVNDATGIANFELGNSPTTVPDATGTANFSLGTYPTSIPPLYQSVIPVPQKATGTMISPAHADGTTYNMLNLKSAYANGKVSLPKDEKALVNEIGQESIIRDGKWQLIPGGMHIQSLKKGDIILNAKQTEDLLHFGKTNGHARSYAYGSLLSAYASGGFLPTPSNNYKYTGAKSYSSKTTKSSKNNTSNNISQAAQSATKATEDLFDFVKILRDCAKELTEKLTDAIDDAVGLANKMSANSSALTQIQKEISVNQQAYQKYLAQANSVGLSEAYASQIRNGSLNIENITDEDLKKKLDEYQKWHDEAKDCEEAIRDLQKQEKELAISRLEYIEDYYDAIENLNDAYRDVNDARIEFNDAIGSSAISNEVRGYLTSSLQKQEDSYNKALQQLADYQNETNELIAAGYLQKDSIEYYEAMETIQEFTKQVDETATAVVEMQDKIRELDYTKLQQIIDMADRRTDQLKNKQSLAESRDELISREELQGQVDTLHESLSTNYELREKKLQEQGLYDVTSTRYQELAEEIADIDSEIYGSLEDIEDLKNQIFENEFFNYEKEQSNLEYFIGELEDFAGLLNEDGYFDKTGGFTETAYAKIALVGEAMATSKKEIANATEALKKLDEMLASGLITETEYIDKQHDLLDTIRDSVGATEDYKNELLDLYKKQMQKEVDYLDEVIDKRKAALKAKADYYSYDKKIKDQTKDLNSLKAQIAALEGVFALSILIAGTS